MMQIKIFPNEYGANREKLADVELHFTGGPLAGLKLVGFALWKASADLPHLTFPQREYTDSMGMRRKFTMLRPITDPTAARGLTEAILEAYDEDRRLYSPADRRLQR